MTKYYKDVKSIGYIREIMTPINGYGLTLNSIRSWLEDHHLKTEPKNLNLDTDDTYDGWNTLIQPLHNDIEYIGNDETGEEFLMYTLQQPQNESIRIPSTNEIKRQLQATINTLFNTPKEMHNQNDLSNFINEYSGDILDCIEN